VSINFSKPYQPHNKLIFFSELGFEAQLMDATSDFRFTGKYSNILKFLKLKKHALSNADCLILIKIVTS